jgi:cell division protein FtsQ
MTRRGAASPTVPGPGGPGPGEGGAEPGAVVPGLSQPNTGQPNTGRGSAGQSGAGAGTAAGRPARRAGDPWRAAFLAVLAIAIVLGAGWALLGSSLLVVRHVEVTGNRQVPAAAVRAAAGIQAGTPLARLDAAAATRRVERIAQVLSARVTRSWPDTVVISVRERTPSLAVASNGLFELVDIHGVVVRTSARRPAGLPLLDSAPPRLAGSPAVRAAVLVLGDLPAALRRRVTSVSTAAVDNAVTLYLRGGITVRWGGTGRAAAKARELQSLMRTHARRYDVSAPGVAVTSR